MRSAVPVPTPVPMLVSATRLVPAPVSRLSSVPVSPKKAAPKVQKRKDRIGSHTPLRVWGVNAREASATVRAWPGST